MTWGHQREHTCIEPDCRCVFLSASNNVDRCPDCRKKHNNAVRQARLKAKRGALYGKQGKHPPMSDATRFNMMMAKAFKNARCPKCGKHMKRCQCSGEAVRTYRRPVVATFRPWEMPLPKSTAD